jgi:hypothetical protein
MRWNPIARGTPGRALSCCCFDVYVYLLRLLLLMFFFGCNFSKVHRGGGNFVCIPLHFKSTMGVAILACVYL